MTSVPVEQKHHKPVSPELFSISFAIASDLQLRLGPLPAMKLLLLTLAALLLLSHLTPGNLDLFRGGAGCGE